MTLFQSKTGKQGILVQVNFNQSDTDLGLKLWNWFKKEHNQFFCDIEMNEGGKMSINKSRINFIGRKGIFTLEAVETATI